MGNLECLQNKHSTAQEIKSESFMEDPAVPEHYKHRVDANGRLSNSGSSQQSKEVQRGNVKVVII